MGEDVLLSIIKETPMSLFIVMLVIITKHIQPVVKFSLISRTDFSISL